MTGPRRLLVGAPTRYRHWILPRWREHLLRAIDELDPASIEFAGFVFVVSVDDDRERELVESWPEPTRVIVVREPPRPADVRDWSQNRLALMAALRNKLLGEGVRPLAPDLFLSLDTDMLLDPAALAGMVGVLDKADADDPGRVWAVGGKAHMICDGRSADFPSYAFCNADATDFQRFPSDQVLAPNVIMGIKLMTPPAYNVDYRYHPSGEDIGWSLAVAEAGGSFLWDGRYCNKHVTDYPWLYLTDPRVGW